MAKEAIIVGLDIGSQTIKILGAVHDQNSDLYRVYFFEEVPSVGVSKGRIRDEKALTKKLADLFEKIEEKYNIKLDTVISNISGSRLELAGNRASISVGGANGKVSEVDKERVLEDVKAINLGNNKKIIKIFPKEWSLDGEKEIADPFGLQGIRLELDAAILTCFSSDREILDNAIFNAGVDIEDLIPTPFADANAILNETQKELGVVLVDIGAGTTSMIVYEEGKLIDLAIFPVGASHITNDIAIGLQTEINVAEKIKREYGLGGSTNKKIEINTPSFLIDEDEEDVDEKNKLVFTEKNLKDITEPRVSEIFDFIKERLKVIGKEKLPAGVVITGGGANLKGLEEFAKKEFKLPAKIVCCDKFIGLERRDPAYSTVCGLILTGSDFDGAEDLREEKGISSKIKDFFKNLVP